MAMTESELSNTEKKLCLRCGKPGSGPHPRWVMNSRKKRYEPYYYFAHRVNGKLKWCYLGKKKLDNVCENTKPLSNFSEQQECSLP